MRTEKEMYDLILGKANSDDRIRAVILSGSRANPNAKKDIFQDYDIIYIVRNIESFKSDHSWVDEFGERIMMQMPEDKVWPPPLNNGSLVYLMQFKDGNRIDLTLIPQEKSNELLNLDSLNKLLLDKDSMFTSIQQSSDIDYHINQPSEKEFTDCCNEFWWISMNIAKGLWREELPYAMFMYEQINRNVLIKMIKWHVGMKTDFSKSVGNQNKYLKDYLNKDEWEKFVSTYTDADYENIWDGLFQMCHLFRNAALKVAEHFNFEYPIEEDKNVISYLQHIRTLPKDANAIY